MLRATESEILQQYEKTYTGSKMQGNTVAELEHVEFPSVALESGESSSVVKQCQLSTGRVARCQQGFPAQNLVKN